LNFEIFLFFEAFLTDPKMKTFVCYMIKIESLL